MSLSAPQGEPGARIRPPAGAQRTAAPASRRKTSRRIRNERTGRTTSGI